ncbi:hypothetical protein EW026_g305 [Hermanssonia centrifuga]|uniref:Uncharacterized protein n=1 Tax=Hermanssonia centrifuga TaxID=98765 RepID=A0A4S4KV04_9APHY|nr:hypothetical protein EW026_g305 [Hermanssonia centrifuga]
MVAAACQQSVNADISGIGVRLSFYLQNFLLVILVDRSWQDAPGALWTFISTSFGLTIAAVVQARQGQLSFFQAVTVTNLVWLANFGTFLALASYSRHRIKEEEKGQDGVITKKLRKANKKGGANHKMKVAAMLQTVLSMILTIMTWAKPDAFQLIDSDGNPDVACNVDFKYVAFFAVSFPASESHPGKLSPGQKLGLTVSVMLMIVYAAVTVHETFSYTRRKRHTIPSDQEAQRQDEGDKPPVPPKVIITPAVPMPEPSFELLQANSPAPSIMLSQRSHSSLGGYSLPPSISEPPTRPRGPRRPPPKPPFREVDPMFLGITMVQTIIFVYFIVVTELLLKRNKQADNSGGLWGFGQSCIEYHIMVMHGRESNMQQTDHPQDMHPEVPY